MNLPFPPPSLMPDILASSTLLLALLIGGWVTRRALRARKDLPPQAARRWGANVRNALLLIAVIGLMMIWAPQLRTFALSLTAVAVAIVVATKELILCLSGAALRTFTRAYTIGDYIEIDGIRGEVVDISLLAARLREIDHRGSGALPRNTIVPHSLMFAHPVRVLAHAGASAEYAFALVFETGVDLFSRQAELTAVAVFAWQKEGAARGSDNPVTVDDLRVRVTTTELGRLKLEIAFRTRPEAASTVERTIAAAVGSFVLSLVSEAQSADVGK